jgi:hypothetical protein
MRLQLLSDTPDAFKWDLVHWLCARSTPAYSHLLFIPMLRPDEPGSPEGQTPHERFNCRPEIRAFLRRLRAEPSLATLRELGRVDPNSRFEVVIWPPEDRYVGSGVGRAAYWEDWSLDGTSNALAFIDPDTGFETTSCDGAKWVRHTEVERVLHGLPGAGGVIVYQHRPQRQRWGRVFEGLRGRLGYAAFAAAVFNGNVAFVLLARTREAWARLETAATAYKANHGSVYYQVLDGRSGEARPVSAASRVRRGEPRACECGCGGLTQRRFVPGHDSILRAWVTRVERSVIDLNDIPHDGIRAAVAQVLSQRSRQS